MFSLIDCNNFYASCEEVFQPKLSKYPLIILSNNDGIVVARSKKAKELGIRVGDAAFLFKDRIDRKEIIALSANFTLYADMSYRVMQALESYSPEMEIYSIDEAFFNIESEPDEIMREKALLIREKVMQWTGISVSVGIGPTKTLAKLSNEIAKKDPALGGVALLVDPNSIREQLEKTELDDIWGIGSGLSRRLKAKQIYTAAKLIDCPDISIQKIIGVTGYRTVLELRGTSCLSVNHVENHQKSIICSRSFKIPIREKGKLLEMVAAFISHAAEKLRKQKCQAGLVTVVIASSPFIEPFESKAIHIALPSPSAYTPELIRIAKEATEPMFREGCAYKKVFTMLSDFQDESIEQTNFLSTPIDTPKRCHLMKTVDAINRRYDKKAVHFAAEGFDRRWRSSRPNATQKYTTSWNELLTVS